MPLRRAPASPCGSQASARRSPWGRWPTPWGETMSRSQPGTASSYLQRSDWNLHNRFVRKNLIDLPNKNAAVPVVLILAAGVACPQDVKHLLRTIDNLTQKESL